MHNPKHVTQIALLPVYRLYSHHRHLIHKHHCCQCIDSIHTTGIWYTNITVASVSTLFTPQAFDTQTSLLPVYWLYSHHRHLIHKHHCCQCIDSIPTTGIPYTNITVASVSTLFTPQAFDTQTSLLAVYQLYSHRRHLIHNHHWCQCIDSIHTAGIWYTNITVASVLTLFPPQAFDTQTSLLAVYQLYSHRRHSIHKHHCCQCINSIHTTGIWYTNITAASVLTLFTPQAFDTQTSLLAVYRLYSHHRHSIHKHHCCQCIDSIPTTGIRYTNITVASVLTLFPPQAFDTQTSLLPVYWLYSHHRHSIHKHHCCQCIDSIPTTGIRYTNITVASVSTLFPLQAFDTQTSLLAVYQLYSHHRHSIHKHHCWQCINSIPTAGIRYTNITVASVLTLFTPQAFDTQTSLLPVYRLYSHHRHLIHKHHCCQCIDSIPTTSIRYTNVTVGSVSTLFKPQAFDTQTSLLPVYQLYSHRRHSIHKHHWCQCINSFHTTGIWYINITAASVSTLFTPQAFDTRTSLLPVYWLYSHHGHSIHKHHCCQCIDSIPTTGIRYTNITVASVLTLFPPQAFDTQTSLLPVYWLYSHHRHSIHKHLCCQCINSIPTTGIRYTNITVASALTLFPPQAFDTQTSLLPVYWLYSHHCCQCIDSIPPLLPVYWLYSHHRHLIHKYHFCQCIDSIPTTGIWYTNITVASVSTLFPPQAFYNQSTA